MCTLQTKPKMGEDDLLATIDLYKDDHSASSKKALQEALSEILTRHQSYLYAVAKHVAQRFPLLDYEVIYSEFAIKLIELAGKFKYDKEAGRSLDKQYKYWAGAIISLITKQMLKGATQEILDEEYVLNSASSTLDDEESEKIQLLRDLMEEHLTERECNVLWAWSLIQPLDGGAGRTPPEELEKLAKSLGTTKVNLRQIRKRALDKLREAGADIMN